MNKQEAYRELGLNQGASEDEIKSAFRKAAAKNHPDRFTDPVEKEKAEAKFKNLNTAQQVLLSPEPEQTFQNPFQGGFGGFGRQNINDFFSNFVNMHQDEGFAQKPNIQININLTFEEAILGCEKEIKYQRENKCSGCNGNGKTKGRNACQSCGGQGRVVMQHGNFRIQQGCPHCGGTGGSLDLCTKCNGASCENQEISAKVKIPPILKKEQSIRITGGGNFVHNDNFGQSFFTDLFLNPIIESNKELSVNEHGEVISTINISLLDALEGTTKTVYTVKGFKDLKIKPRSKNKDTIFVPECGAGGKKAHIVYLNVDYPNDIDILVASLKAAENNVGN